MFSYSFSKRFRRVFFSASEKFLYEVSSNSLESFSVTQLYSSPFSVSETNFLLLSFSHFLISTSPDFSSFFTRTVVVDLSRLIFSEISPKVMHLYFESTNKINPWEVSKSGSPRSFMRVRKKSAEAEWIFEINERTEETE